MGRSCPESLQVVLEVLVGLRWPEADEDALRSDADHWERLGAAVAEARDHAQPAASALLAENSGQATAAFGRAWEHLCTQQLPQAITVCDGLAAALREFAGDVEATKEFIVLQLGILTAEVGLGIAGTVLTFGVSDIVAEGAVVATRLVIRRACTELVERALATAARLSVRGMVDGLLNDTMLQGLRAANGGSAFDAREFLGAGAAGAAGGLVGGKLAGHVPGTGHLAVRIAGHTAAGLGGNGAAALAQSAVTGAPITADALLGGVARGGLAAGTFRGVVRDRALRHDDGLLPASLPAGTHIDPGSTDTATIGGRPPADPSGRVPQQLAEHPVHVPGVRDGVAGEIPPVTGTTPPTSRTSRTDPEREAGPATGREAAGPHVPRDSPADPADGEASRTATPDLDRTTAAEGDPREPAVHQPVTASGRPDLAGPSRADADHSLDHGPVDPATGRPGVHASDGAPPPHTTTARLDHDAAGPERENPPPGRGRIAEALEPGPLRPTPPDGPAQHVTETDPHRSPAPPSEGSIPPSTPHPGRPPGAYDRHPATPVAASRDPAQPATLGARIPSADTSPTSTPLAGRTDATPIHPARSAPDRIPSTDTGRAPAPRPDVDSTATPGRPEPRSETPDDAYRAAPPHDPHAAEPSSPFHADGGGPPSHGPIGPRHELPAPDPAAPHAERRDHEVERIKDQLHLPADPGTTRALATAYDVATDHTAPFLTKIADDMLPDLRAEVARDPERVVAFVGRDGRSLAIATHALDPDFFDRHCVEIVLSRATVDAAVQDLAAQTGRTFPELDHFRDAAGKVSSDDVAGTWARLTRYLERSGVPIQSEAPALTLVDTSYKGTVQVLLSSLYPHARIQGRYAFFAESPHDPEPGTKQGYALHLIGDAANGGIPHRELLPDDPALTFSNKDAVATIEETMHGPESSPSSIGPDGPVQSPQRLDPDQLRGLNPDKIHPEFTDPAVREAVKHLNLIAVDDYARNIASLRDRGHDITPILDHGATSYTETVRHWITGEGTDPKFQAVADAFVRRADKGLINDLLTTLHRTDLDADATRAIWERFDQFPTLNEKRAFLDHIQELHSPSGGDSDGRIP